MIFLALCGVSGVFIFNLKPQYIRTGLKNFGSKNDPKNTKNHTFFAEKLWENILTYFQEFLAKIYRFWSKNGWFYKILEKF